mmetsp:Transcript_58419/g.153893  ORF Transcript_58419/g.153893 Transcript_58419/m.153893 type:complete len:212 (-) Transcript_58419:332-967(-)
MTGATAITATTHSCRMSSSPARPSTLCPADGTASASTFQGGWSSRRTFLESGPSRSTGRARTCSRASCPTAWLCQATNCWMGASLPATTARAGRTTAYTPAPPFAMPALGSTPASPSSPSTARTWSARPSSSAGSSRAPTECRARPWGSAAAGTSRCCAWPCRTRARWNGPPRSARGWCPTACSCGSSSPDRSRITLRALWTMEGRAFLFA